MLHDIRDYHIFMANLMGVTSDMKVDEKKSKVQNIQQAILEGKIEQLQLLYVKKTIYRNLYQEIITGKMIPAFRDIRLLSIFEKVKGPKASAFIKVGEDLALNGRRISLNHLNRYENYKLNSYYKEHPSQEEFLSQINELCHQAEDNYEKAALRKV